MSNPIIPPLPLTPPAPLLSLLRLSLLSVISQQYGIQNFTRESLDDLSIFIYKFVACLVMKVKDIVANQGRVVANFLHLMFGCECMGYQIDRLMSYLQLKRRRLSTTTRVPKNFQVRRLLSKQTSFLGQQVEDICYPNILTIPSHYLTMTVPENECLPVHYSVSQLVKKPPEYSYITEMGRVSGNIDERKLEREQIMAENEMRVELARLRKVVVGGEKEEGEDRKSWMRGERYGQKVGKEKVMFQLFKYL